METKEPQRRRERGRDARQVQAHPVAGGGGENLEDRGGQARRGAEVEPHLGPLPVPEEIEQLGQAVAVEKLWRDLQGGRLAHAGAVRPEGGERPRRCRMPPIYRSGLNIR